MPCRIEDYALIGDCETAALVGRNGSIDWLCWPRFDSGACFAALLGAPEHGRWLHRARRAPEHVSARRYRDDTLILETDFETADGAVTLIDFMPPRGKASDVVRLVVGRRGQVAMRTELVLRFDYGRGCPGSPASRTGALAVAGPDHGGLAHAGQRCAARISRPSASSRSSAGRDDSVRPDLWRLASAAAGPDRSRWRRSRIPRRSGPSGRRDFTVPGNGPSRSSARSSL